jgi:hypothetical protein
LGSDYWPSCRSDTLSTNTIAIRCPSSVKSIVVVLTAALNLAVSRSLGVVGSRTSIDPCESGRLLCIGQGWLFVIGWPIRHCPCIRSPPWAGQVKLAFSTKELRERCEIQVEGDRAYGAAVAEQIRERLADLIDSETVFELPTGNPRAVQEDGGSYYVIELPEGCRMIIRANHGHKTLPKLREAGGIDWTRVTRVTVNIIDPREAGHDK